MRLTTIALLKPETLNGEHIINGIGHLAKIESSIENGYYIALHAFHKDRLISQIMIWADLNEDGSISISHSIKKCELFLKAKDRNYRVSQDDLISAGCILNWCKRNIKFPFK